MSLVQRNQGSRRGCHGETLHSIDAISQLIGERMNIRIPFEKNLGPVYNFATAAGGAFWELHVDGMMSFLKTAVPLLKQFSNSIANVV